MDTSQRFGYPSWYPLGRLYEYVHTYLPVLGILVTLDISAVIRPPSIFSLIYDAANFGDKVFLSKRRKNYHVESVELRRRLVIYRRNFLLFEVDVSSISLGASKCMYACCMLYARDFEYFKEIFSTYIAYELVIRTVILVTNGLM
jgi:hypothetical protein